jgi:hypothetical protein
MRQKLAYTAILAGIILVIKPQWCFPLLYALALKQDRWFIKAILTSGAAYAGLSALFVMLAGGERGLGVLGDYYQFVFTLQARYPWQGVEAMFDTIQNSIYQTFLRYGFATSIAAPGTLLIQVSLVAGLGVLMVRVRQNPTPQRALLVTFAGYIVAMCLLPQLEEVLLAGIIAASLWMAYRPARLYPVYALLEFLAVVAATTGIQALFLYMTFPVSLVILIILFVGIAITVLRGESQSHVPNHGRSSS